MDNPSLFRSTILWLVSLGIGCLLQFEFVSDSLYAQQQSNSTTVASEPNSEQVVLEIALPIDFQVFQRETAEHGRVRVVGQLNQIDSSSIRIESRWIKGEQSSEWEPLQVPLVNGKFSATLQQKAGGWYRFEIRAKREEKTIASIAVEHVGVGEVFVVAGQSNSANHGEEKQSTQTGMVSAFDGQKWHLANDPIPGASGKGGSFLPPLGDRLAEKLRVPIGFVSCGVGATSIREWLPKGSSFPNPPTIENRVERREDGTWISKGQAYDGLLARCQTLGDHGFRAVLWHQGESDANQRDESRTLKGELYRQYLGDLIGATRRDTGWHVPWFVAQVSYHVPGDEASADIRNAQASSWKDGLAIEGPDSDSLKSPWRERNGQGVHFSGPGLRQHAGLWYDKILEWLTPQLQAK